MIFLPEQLLQRLFDALYDGARTRWGRALLGGVFGMMVGTVAMLAAEGFQGWVTVLTAIGSGLLGFFVGLGLTFVDDRADAEEEALARGEPISAVKTYALYFIYCLIGLLVIVGACALFVAVVMGRH
jgi:hypothetical protein